MVLQLLAGAAGNVLDIFFQNSALDRKTIVGHQGGHPDGRAPAAGCLFRLLRPSDGRGLPWWIYAVAMLTAFAGTSMAAFVLHRMSDADFRRWSRIIIRAVSLTYVARGLWLLGLLARPHDARHPDDVGGLHDALGVIGVERGELDRLGGLRFSSFTITSPPVVFTTTLSPAPHGRGGRADDDVSVPVERQHRIARHLERVDIALRQVREVDLVPAFADREAPVVEEAAGSGLGEAQQGQGAALVVRLLRRRSAP